MNGLDLLFELRWMTRLHLPRHEAHQCPAYSRTCRVAWRVMRSAVGNDPTSLIMSEKVYLLTTYNVCDFVHLSVAVTESDKTTKQTSTTIIR